MNKSTKITIYLITIAICIIALTLYMTEYIAARNPENANIITINKWTYYGKWNNKKYIYTYQNNSGSFWKKKGFKKIKINDDFPYCIKYYKGKIYYENRNDNCSIYSIKPDGTERKKLTKDYTYDYSLHKDKLYVRTGFQLFRINLDGSKLEIIYNYQPVKYFIENDVIIVAINNNYNEELEELPEKDKIQGIISMNLDGTNSKLLKKMNVGILNIANNWIYCSDYETREYFKMRFDGSELQKTKRFTFE